MRSATFSHEKRNRSDTPMANIQSKASAAPIKPSACCKAVATAFPKMPPGICGGAVEINHIRNASIPALAMNTSPNAGASIHAPRMPARARSVFAPSCANVRVMRCYPTTMRLASHAHHHHDEKPNHRNNKSAVQLPARPPQLAMDFACTACVQQGSDGEKLSSAIDKKRTSASWPSQRVSSNRRVIRCGGWEAVERGDFAMKIELGFLLVKQLGMRVIAP